VLTNHIPDGFQLEVRHDDGLAATTFRYKRIADETWCQEVVADVFVDTAISINAWADSVLESVARKFREFDAVAC